MNNTCFNPNQRTNTLVVRFRISGRLVWLSHLETASMLQRVLIRACVPICYSQGFNPHPRMSLPLPRSVGLASDDELVSVQISDPQTRSANSLLNILRIQTPMDCELYHAELFPDRTAFEAVEADYVISLDSRKAFHRTQCSIQKLDKKLQDNEPIFIMRQRKNGQQQSRNMARFLKSVTWRNEQVVAQCRISPEGTIRLDELLNLLKLTPTDLACPILRKRVEWIRK
ncbi:MAG: DUF2344 domain-containing protein [Sedimentisphaerales bacterium]|nr:DUF2344 domain-containing protein [Sedimentisphaerales bacterium]